ncbi:MAG: outer membrane lipoprotein chaperone LolA [Glaciecola sp.]|jgi:outer membrane lipoprotein carrier protein
MLRIVLYLCCLFLSTAHAQDKAADTQLKVLLSEIKSFSSPFTQQVYNGQELLQEAQGTLTLQRPQRLFWHVTAPDETQLITKGEEVYLIDPFLEQVSIFSLAQMLPNNPLLLLLNDDQHTWDEFSITLSKLGDALTFAVVPKASNAQITQLSLTFATGRLLGMTFTDAQNQRSELVFLAPTINATVASDVFDIEIPDGYSIDDQRAIPATAF